MRLAILSIIISSAVSMFSQNLFPNIENVAHYLQTGESETAFSILKKSATTNNIYAQFYVAQCYENGIGTDINLTSAFFMYRKAAERGLPQAMKELARCYLEGIGVEKNTDKAARWFNRYNANRNIKDMPDIIALYDSQTSYSGHLLSSTSADSSKKTIDQNNNPKIEYNIKSNNNQQSSDIQGETPTFSDVDIDLPKNVIANENTFALIFANEIYQDVAQVNNAINDGEIFSKYCHQILGIPEDNIHLVKNATLNNMKRELNVITQIANAYKGEASFIFYYAGHGIPDEKTHSSFLLPVDGFTADISTCFSLDDFYEILGELPSKKNVVFIDACFSGSVRGNGMLVSARGIAIKSTKGTPKGNTLIISSSQGDETAYSYEEKKHGLFTYFILKKLKESRGNTSLGELVDYVIENVSKKSIVINGKSQTPSVDPSEKIINQWSNWTLLK